VPCFHMLQYSLIVPRVDCDNAHQLQDINAFNLHMRKSHGALNLLELEKMDWMISWQGRSWIVLNQLCDPCQIPSRTNN